MPSFSINGPALVSTTRPPFILWRLRSHKPSHKLDSNKYQSKPSVICDHKSDETRAVMHVNKAYLVLLMFRVLSNQHYPHCTNQQLRSWANAVFWNRGVCGQAFPSFPFPSPAILFFFFLLLSQLSRRTRAETLATQAIGAWIFESLNCWCIKGLWCCSTSMTRSKLSLLQDLFGDNILTWQHFFFIKKHLICFS